MKTLTTILSLAATLTMTLGCDAEPELEFGAGDNVTERDSWGIRLNTSFMGAHLLDHVDLDGAIFEYTQLRKVCLPAKYDDLCLKPNLGEIWVQGGEIQGRHDWMHFSGNDFEGSKWYFDIDYDRDGTMDSSIVPRIEKVDGLFTPRGTKFLAYYWTYLTADVSGLARKYIEQSPDPVPVCEKDVDTGSMMALSNEELYVDMKSGEFKVRPGTMFIACASGAVGKVQHDWGYLNLEVGMERHELATRVARADYCSDGMSWTTPGTALQIEDLWGFNAFADAERPTEAHWITGGGAACLGTPRHPDVNFEDVHNHCGIPQCEENKSVGAYGDEIQTKIW